MRGRNPGMPGDTAGACQLWRIRLVSFGGRWLPSISSDGVVSTTAQAMTMVALLQLSLRYVQTVVFLNIRKQLGRGLRTALPSQSPSDGNRAAKAGFARSGSPRTATGPTKQLGSTLLANRNPSNLTGHALKAPTRLVSRTSAGRPRTSRRFTSARQMLRRQRSKRFCFSWPDSRGSSHETPTPRLLLVPAGTGTTDLLR